MPNGTGQGETDRPLIASTHEDAVMAVFRTWKAGMAGGRAGTGLK